MHLLNINLIVSEINKRRRCHEADVKNILKYQNVASRGIQYDGIDEFKRRFYDANYRNDL